MMNKMTKTAMALAVAAAALAPTLVSAQSYPTKPVRVVLGYPQGGASDLIMRTFTGRMGNALKQTVLVENRAGNGGADAGERVAKAPNDGYTMLMANTTLMAMVPATGKVDYDATSDFEAVHYIGRTPNVLVVHPSVQAKTVAELVTALKAKPDGLSYASSGLGTIQHFAGEMFKIASGTAIKHVPYRGSGQAIGYLLSGEVSMSFDNLPSVMSHINSGKLRPLAVLSEKRVDSIKSVPTMAEAGVKGVEISNWYGLVGPKGMAKDASARISAEMGKIMALPEVQKELLDLGVTVEPLKVADLQRLLKTEPDRFLKIARAAKITKN